MEMEFKPSISEEVGLSLIRETDNKILSIGISTLGLAEAKMVECNNERYVIATTLDKDGLENTRQFLKEKNLLDRIELKLEDVSKPMPYKDKEFDFIYARLVLHYLKNEDLKKALAELYRVLKEDGIMYVVVRSRDEWEAKLEGTTYDEETGITRYPRYKTIGTNNIQYIERRLHTKESITSYLIDAGFRIERIKEFSEQLYSGYMRTEKILYPASLIEVVTKR